MRYIFSFIYEALLLATVLLFAGLIYSVVFRYRSGAGRIYFQAYLLAVAAGYFTWFWSGARQSLAMKAWRLVLRDRVGQPLTIALALERFALALVCYAAGGLSLIWFLFTKRTLHDRLLGTRLLVLKSER